MRKIFLILLTSSALMSTAVAAQPAAPMAPDRGALDAAPPPSVDAPRARGRFAAMDADGDGKVTLQEFIAFQDRAFDRIDVQHKGQIDKADVDAAIAQAQLRQAGGMTRGRRAGAGGERLLTQLSNRLAQGGSMTRDMWEKRAAKRFQRLDVAHVGYITADQLRAAQRPEASDG